VGVIRAPFISGLLPVWILKYEKKIEKDPNFSGHSNFSLYPGTSGLSPLHPTATI
jgi:hypothetical protein